MDDVWLRDPHSVANQLARFHGKRVTRHADQPLDHFDVFLHRIEDDDIVLTGLAKRRQALVDQRDFCAVEGFIDEQKIANEQRLLHAPRRNPECFHQKRPQHEPDDERHGDRLGPVPNPGYE